MVSYCIHQAVSFTTRINFFHPDKEENPASLEQIRSERHHAEVVAVELTQQHPQHILELEQRHKKETSRLQERLETQSPQYSTSAAPSSATNE